MYWLRWRRKTLPKGCFKVVLAKHRAEWSPPPPRLKSHSSCKLNWWPLRKQVKQSDAIWKAVISEARTITESHTEWLDRRKICSFRNLGTVGKQTEKSCMREWEADIVAKWTQTSLQLKVSGMDVSSGWRQCLLVHSEKCFLLCPS